MNEIIMSQKQMMDALETYLNEHVLKESVTVSGVSKDSSPCGMFTIRINVATAPGKSI